jgi:hypothetical protein
LLHKATVEPPETTVNPDLKFTAQRFTSDGGAKDVQTPAPGLTAGAICYRPSISLCDFLPLCGLYEAGLHVIGVP